MVPQTNNMFAAGSWQSYCRRGKEKGRGGGRKREGRRDLSSLEPNNESVNKTPTHRQRHRARATSLSFVGGFRVGDGGFDVIRLVFSLLQMTDPQGIHEIHSRLPSISHNHWGVFFLDSPNNDDPAQAFSCTAEKGSKREREGDRRRERRVGKGKRKHQMRETRDFFDINQNNWRISLQLRSTDSFAHFVVGGEGENKLGSKHSNSNNNNKKQFHINLSYLR